MTRSRLFVLVGVALSIAAFLPGREITVAMQAPLFESLRTTAGIIFAVMAAWIALLYPHARDAVLKAGEVRTDDDRRVGRMIRPMVTSTLVLAVVLLFGPMVAVVRHIPLAYEYIPELRGFSFAVLVALTLTLLGTVLATLLPLLWWREATEAPKRQEEAATILRRVG